MLELLAQRKLTAAFIATQPVVITLTPMSRVQTPSGGTAVEAGTPREPQIMRLIEPSDSLARGPVRFSDGYNREMPDYMLLGTHVAEMALDDVFTYAGDQFQITQMMHDNGWERRAQVERHGPK